MEITTTIFWSSLCFATVLSYVDGHRIQSRYLPDTFQAPKLGNRLSATIGDKDSLQNALKLMNIGKKTLGLKTDDPQKLIQMVDIKADPKSSSKNIANVLQNSREYEPSKSEKQILYLTGDEKRLHLDKKVNVTGKPALAKGNGTGIEDVFEMTLEKNLLSLINKEAKPVQKIKITETDRMKPLSSIELRNLVHQKNRKKRNNEHHGNKNSFFRHNRSKRTKDESIISISFHGYSDTSNVNNLLHNHNIGDRKGEKKQEIVTTLKYDNLIDEHQVIIHGSLLDTFPDEHDIFQEQLAEIPFERKDDNFNRLINEGVSRRNNQNFGRISKKYPRLRNIQRMKYENMDSPSQDYVEPFNQYRNWERLGHRNNLRNNEYDNVLRNELDSNDFAIPTDKLIATKTVTSLITQHEQSENQINIFWIKFAIIVWVIFMLGFSLWLIYSNCYWKQKLQGEGLDVKVHPKDYDCKPRWKNLHKERYVEIPQSDDLSDLLEWQSENGDWFV